jgi:hypothetical protein
MRHFLSTVLACAVLVAESATPSVLNDEAISVSMQKLNDIVWEPGDEIPEEIAVYDGQRIEISGYMRNGTVEDERWFDLTNDSCGCGTSKLQHFVRVTLEEGTVTFDPGELILTGSFEVSEREDEDGFVESIYRLKIASLGS